jgi:hypothetical protein
MKNAARSIAPCLLRHTSGLAALGRCERLEVMLSHRTMR